jgi:hypothetical protein
MNECTGWRLARGRTKRRRRRGGGGRKKRGGMEVVEGGREETEVGQKSRGVVEVESCRVEAHGISDNMSRANTRIE